MFTRPSFQRYAGMARLLAPLKVAFVYPCDRLTLQTAQTGAFAGFIDPVLVGPAAGIRAAAEAAGIDALRFPIVETAGDDPRAAAARAVELARQGAVQALVKGTLGNDEFLAPVADGGNGLRTQRRLSHASVLELPERAEPLLLADARLNVKPNIAAKKDILENTIDLALALGVRPVRIAAVAATDVVMPSFPSTADAAALRSMAAQGLFAEARVYGPVTIDRALATDPGDLTPALVEGGGRAEVILAPDMEAAVLILQTLVATTRALAAGLVLGARVPIIASSRDDALEARLASCVLASLMAAVNPATLRRSS